MPSARLAFITVSDTRTPATDKNGPWLRSEAAKADLPVVLEDLVPDEPEAIREALGKALVAQADVVVFNGGTGMGTRDTTTDVIAPLLDKPMPGFGELFRMLSWEEIGSAAMLSRAVAGRRHNTMVFVLPGSHAAVQLAWKRLIAPELVHLMRELHT